MQTVKVEGLKELERALSELPKATAKNTVKRILMSAADPIDSAASQAAPEDTGRLERSVIVGSQLTRRQRGGGARRVGGGFRSESKNYVEVHVGTTLGRGMFTEFGTFKDPAQGWFRSAWEATKHRALDIIVNTLGSGIERSAARSAKRQARL